MIFIFITILIACLASGWFVVRNILPKVKRRYKRITVALDEINTLMQQQVQTQNLIQSLMDQIHSSDTSTFITNQQITASYGQTINDQQLLFSALQKAATINTDNEIPLFSAFFNYYPITFPAITLYSALETQQLTKFASNTTFSCITPTKHQAVDFHQVPHTNYFFISNPNIANIALLTPHLIKKLSRNIKNAFIFPIHNNLLPFIVSWDNSFSDYENNEQHHWRWMIGSTGIGTITLTNNSLNTQIIDIDFKIFLLEDSHSNLEIYFLNKRFQYRLAHLLPIKLKLTVPPGSHQLILAYKGKPHTSAHDARSLNFAVADLNIHSENGNMHLTEKAVYNTINSTALNPLSDAMIRHTLHSNGFFEVEALACSNTNSFKKLSTTRFHVTNHYYELTPAEPINDHQIVWYIAKRDATLHEMN